MIADPDRIEPQRLRLLGDHHDRLRRSQLPKVRKSDPEMHRVASPRRALVSSADAPVDIGG
jgi:hypothetical protein